MDVGKTRDECTQSRRVIKGLVSVRKIATENFLPSFQNPV
jgi:hypothetical protein